MYCTCPVYLHNAIVFDFRNVCFFLNYSTSYSLHFLRKFKGTVSRDFLLLVFSWISFPQAPEYTIRAVSKFFENSRRYSQLKVDHRYQRHRWQIYHRCQRHRRQKFIYMLTLLSKGVPFLKFFWLKIFFICHWCQRHRWSSLSCEYSREFSKKFETVLIGYSGAGGKLIHEKNQEQKISWHCPFKLLLSTLSPIN